MFFGRLFSLFIPIITLTFLDKVFDTARVYKEWMGTKCLSVTVPLSTQQY